MATHSSILAWRIPQTEEPGRFTVHRVEKSWTQLKWLSMHAQNLMSTYCVADFVLEPHIAFKPLWEGHYISFNRWGNWGPERVLWTLWLLRSCQAPQEGSWLSVLPFKYGGGRWGKEAAIYFSFSLVKSILFICSFFSLLEKQTKEILASFMILPLLRSRVRLLPCRALFRDVNKGWLQDSTECPEQ